jgi:hypothetical protein
VRKLSAECERQSPIDVHPAALMCLRNKKWSNSGSAAHGPDQRHHMSIHLNIRDMYVSELTKASVMLNTKMQTLNTLSDPPLGIQVLQPQRCQTGGLVRCPKIKAWVRVVYTGEYECLQKLLRRG